jgi:hypothetical protein
MSNLFQTVVATNYLPFALVMAQSLRQHIPDARLCVLVTDASPTVIGHIRDKFDSWIDFIGCDDLAIDWLNEARNYYSVLEFSSACKILALNYQFNIRGESECIFIDPDMLVLGDFRPLVEKANADIIITYHALAPYPTDSGNPNELELVVSGAINGGFIAMRRSPRQLEALAWLVSKTRAYWFVSPMHGMYADQHWLGYLPQFFGDVTQVLREPAINIAYWNLHERPLQQSGETVLLAVSDKHALLFHFSGFPLEGGEHLTRHANRRFDAATEQATQALVVQYRALLDQQVVRLRASAIQGDRRFRVGSLRQGIQWVRKRYGVRFAPVVHPTRRFSAIRNLIDRFMYG